MLAGHYGPKRTMELICWTFNWPGCSKEIKKWCGTCLPCQPNKPVRHKPYGELVSLPIPVRIWGDITMDFVTDLPPSVGYTGGTYDAIWVVVDRLSKMAHYVPVCKTIDAPDLAGLFIQEVVRLHGLPDSIVSDRGTVFTSKFWSSFCFYLNVRRKLSTAFHPQTDGQTERQNQTMETYL